MLQRHAQPAVMTCADFDRVVSRLPGRARAGHHATHEVAPMTVAGALRQRAAPQFAGQRAVK